MSFKNKLYGNQTVADVFAFGVINEAFVAKLLSDLLFYETFSDCIALHWNSIGGSIYHGVAAYNMIKNCKVPVDVFIDGVAASMGAYSAFGGRKVYMSKFARLMLHEGSVNEGGNVDELREMANEVEACNSNLIAMTCTKTGMAEAAVKEKFFNGQDNWYSAAEAVGLKLVDDIYDLDEVSVPVATNHIEVYAMVTDAYQTGLFTKNTDMDYKLSNEVVATLGLKPGYDANAVNTAVLAMGAENKRLSGEVDKVKAEATTKEITGMLDSALNGKKITVQQKGVFAAKFAKDPEGLKEVLATMGAFTSLDTVLHQAERETEGVLALTGKAKTLFAKGYDALMTSGEMGELKKLNADAYLALYKDKYGYLPNEKPQVKK